MNHLKGDPTRIHTNCSTQKKDPITLVKPTNSKPTKAPKNNTTTFICKLKTNRDFRSKANKATHQDTNQKRKKTSISKIRSNPRPSL